MAQADQTLAPPILRAPRVIRSRPDLQGRRRVAGDRVGTDSIVLGDVTYETLTRSMGAQQILAANLRSNPRIAIGDTRVDFTPVLRNPKALMNIAQRLRSIPSLVQIGDETDGLEALVIPQKGLAIRSRLNYRLLPGACQTASNRAQIAATGIACYTRGTDSQRATSFATRGDVRFVEDANQRVQKLELANTQSQAIASDIAAKVAAFSSQLRDPAKRAELATQIGESEVARLEALDADALENELVNAQENEIEQVSFVPEQNASNDAGATSLGETEPAPARAPPNVNADYDIGTYYFLTGFTLGKEYEYRQRVTTTISWCWVGCKESYYGEVYAGFGYGFGLRFPIQFGGTFNFTRQDAIESASLTPRINPINGNASQYQATGLANDLLFDGKELVAEISAKAGGSAKLPVVGVLAPPEFNTTLDFTTLLPAPFTSGQFGPPAPGSRSPETEFLLESFDLIGGRLNFGVFGGQIFPAVKIGLESEALTLTMLDKVNNVTTILSAASASPVALAIDQSDDSSSFKIENPVYNLSFVITPGLTARLFVDLGLWRNNWDWPVWFPQLSIKLPPDGADFSCHAGTICSRDFRFTPAGVQTEFIGKLNAWAISFENRWIEQCSDQPCHSEIRLLKDGVVSDSKGKEASNPALNFDGLSSELGTAESQARGVAAVSVGRKAGEYASANGALLVAIWSPQCDDELCRTNVANLAGEMDDAAMSLATRPGIRVPGSPSRQAALPTPLSVSQAINAAYVPKFEKEVADSRVRKALSQSRDLRRQMPQQIPIPRRP